MSWNRLGVDNCTYAQKLNQNVSHLGYLLEPMQYEHCSKCRTELGWVGGNNVSKVKGNLVDMESNLFGIDREASKCATMKYLPGESKGKKLNKQVCYQEIDTQKDHLRACQPIHYPAIPNGPKYRFSKCS